MSSFLSSCHEKAKKALYIGRIYCKLAYELLLFPSFLLSFASDFFNLLLVRYQQAEISIAKHPTQVRSNKDMVGSGVQCINHSAWSSWASNPRFRGAWTCSAWSVKRLHHCNLLDVLYCLPFLCFTSMNLIMKCAIQLFIANNVRKFNPLFMKRIMPWCFYVWFFTSFSVSKGPLWSALAFFHSNK